jgi:ADP-ribose pyrophosphatase
MTGANMNLVTVNVKLGENDPEPDQKLEPVCYPMRRSWMLMSRENILWGGSFLLRIFIASCKVGLGASLTGGNLKLMLDYAKKGFAIDALVASVAQGWELAKKFNA